MIHQLVNGSCEETGEYLSAHLEQDLRGPRRVRVARHLARCGPCRAALESLTRTIERLRSLGSFELAPLPSVADGVIARVRHSST
ncbi:MAG: zf-HC2 domain-containing protein [Actinomycetota bacterium]